MCGIRDENDRASKAMYLAITQRYFRPNNSRRTFLQSQMHSQFTAIDTNTPNKFELIT